MKNQKNILVIGAGLSGVCVTYQLIKKGAHVTLMDNGVNHSSSVAAGMINPLVFRRMTKSWRVDNFIPYLKGFYSSIEKEIEQVFFHEIPVIRLLSSKQEQEFWIDKQEQPEFTSYMHPLTEADMNYSGGKNPFGAGRVKETYYVDAQTFLTKIKAWIETNAVYVKEEFDTSLLVNNEYKNVRYDEIIFCQGYLNPSNPWFGDLPLDQTKGETLTIKSRSLPEGVSLNRKCFVLPLKDQKFKIGSTYGWSDPSTTITSAGKEEILQNLSFITDEKVVVLSQEAGVRPTTRDRRPLLGTHPKHKNYHIFNGLGAKGYMLAPLISLEFANYIIDGTPLDKEVNINRYYKKINL